MATIRVPIRLMIPRSSSLGGNAFTSVIALTAYDAARWEFLKDVDGKIYGQCEVPNNLAATPNAKIGIAIAANAASGITRLKCSYKFVPDTASTNPASLTAEASQDITVPATARLRKDVTFPSAGNLTDTPVANDILVVEFFHEGAHANDNLAVNTELWAAWLQVDVT